MDGIVFKVRENSKVINKTIYLALLARAFACIGCKGGGAQQFVLGLATTTLAAHGQAVGAGGHGYQRRVRVDIHQRQTAPAFGLQLQLIQRKTQQTAIPGQAGHLSLTHAYPSRRQALLTRQLGSASAMERV